jgi:hypothetical protein
MITTRRSADRLQRLGVFDLAVAVVAGLVLLAPMLLTDRSFGPDWTVHLWLLWVQGANISEHGPSLFLHAKGLGAFFPHYAFYGGTLYTIGGGLSALLGGRAVTAYLVMWAATFAMAYGGLLWIARGAGLRGWRSHAAPIVFVTSAYFLTNLYARGTWPETTASSAAILTFAAGLHLLRAERVSLLPTLALAWSGLLMTGSHNITLVWGTIVLTAFTAAYVGAARSGLRPSGGRVLLILAVLGCATAVNGWFLVPDLLYGQKTLIANGQGRLAVETSDWFDALSNVFNPLRHTPRQSTSPDLYTQLPVFALAWVVVGCAVVWRQADPGLFWRRAVCGVATVGLVLSGLLLMNWPWDLLPQQLGYIQFTFRLETYILICLALLVIATLAGLQRAPSPSFGSTRRMLEGSLALVVTYGAALAVWQVWDTPSAVRQPNRNQTFASVHIPNPAFYDTGLFRDASAEEIAVPSGRQVAIPLTAQPGDHLHINIDLPQGRAPIGTNIGAGDYLIDVRGVERVGRTADGFMVIRRPAAKPRGPVTLTVEPRSSGTLLAGRVITLLGLLGLAALLVGVAFCRRGDGVRWRR